MRLPTFEEALGSANVECPECLGTGWVCENHPTKAWDHPAGCECGAGMPCRCRPGTTHPYNTRGTTTPLTPTTDGV